MNREDVFRHTITTELQQEIMKYKGGPTEAEIGGSFLPGHDMATPMSLLSTEAGALLKQFRLTLDRIDFSALSARVNVVLCDCDRNRWTGSVRGSGDAVSELNLAFKKAFLAFRAGEPQ